MKCMELSSSCCTENNIHIGLRRVSQESLLFLKGSQATCIVCCGTQTSYIANEGEWALSRVELRYTELFCIPEVTSVFISYCGSVLGDSLVFHQEN